MPISDAVIDFRVPPDPHVARRVREDVSAFALRHHVSDDDLSFFLTALGEALANAIEHARVEEPIVVEVRVGADRILASVHDKGIGLRAPVTTNPELPTLDADRGRGIPIMRRCCDIFAIESAPGKGTAVVLGRFLRREPTEHVA